MVHVFIDTVDLVARGQRCLTFTTPPLEEGVEVTGAPAVDLEIATTADRGAIVATLEQVQADGSVAYLTGGFLNFEHRRTGDAETGHDGPFWHRYLSSDLLPVRPGERMAIRFELYPISCIVRAGDRIRLTLAAAAADRQPAPRADGQRRRGRVRRHRRGLRLPQAAGSAAPEPVGAAGRPSQASIHQDIRASERVWTLHLVLSP